VREFKGSYSQCAYANDMIVGTYENILEVMGKDKMFGHLYEYE
jgi:hypothetical protein